MHLLRGLSALSMAVIFSGTVVAQPAPPKAPLAATPWGVSSSASASRDHAEWFPKMAAAGVTSVRLFHEWNGFQTPKGEWTWEQGDALVKSAAENKLEITAILMGSPPGAKATHAFPMDKLDDWSKYVTAVVGRYSKHIARWEVWNEGNGGFNDGKHTTADYAKLAIATYEAVKKADPKAQVGLSVASFDAPYLNRAILAMAKAGKPNCFDYLCIHPYELADGLVNADGEIPFLWMTKLLRDMLKASAPEKADCEIWITEIGRRIEKKKGHEVTEKDAAKALVKIYTLALAQGIARTQWFEGRDPVGEEPGFGLLKRDGGERDSYKALKSLTAILGPTPKYLGWLLLGEGMRGYGFVFEGKAGPVLVAWMPAGLTDKSLTLPRYMEIIDALTGEPTAIKAALKAERILELSDSPLIVTGLPESMVKVAKEFASKPFFWGGDYSKDKTVSFQPGATGGIFPVGAGESPTIKFPDGSSGLLMQGDIEHPAKFFVHPSFASFATKDYYVRATVRRVAVGNVGMNLFYEIADSQGKSPYGGTGKWFGATADAGWQTYTWHVEDACFSKMWGSDITLRPEKSIPFALGKVEVSTEPFK